MAITDRPSADHPPSLPRDARITRGIRARASGSGGREELAQPGGQLGRRFLGDVVAAVDGLASDVVGPVAPDGERVTIEIFEVVPAMARLE
jgi:hypothetical protein